MPRLPLTFASCRYDRVEALRTGDVQPDGIDLKMIMFPAGRDVFDRMVGGQEFDIAELSASEYISLAGRGDCPFVALPVFPSRVFRHGYIFVNTRAGIRAPKDLEGRRVGVPLYTQTAAIWVRGHLTHQYGVDSRAIRWVQGAVETGGTPRQAACAAAAQAGARSSRTPPASRSASCWRGEIDALIGSRKPPMLGRSPDIARLFAELPRARARVLAAHEDLSDHASDRDPPRHSTSSIRGSRRSLYNAFVEAKARALARMHYGGSLASCCRG